MAANTFVPLNLHLDNVEALSAKMSWGISTLLSQRSDIKYNVYVARGTDPFVMHEAATAHNYSYIPLGLYELKVRVTSIVPELGESDPTADFQVTITSQELTPIININNVSELYRTSTPEDIGMPGVSGNAGFYLRVKPDVSGIEWHALPTDADTIDGLHSNQLVLAEVLAMPSGVATLDLQGKVPTSQLPPLAITDVFAVADQTAMLGLQAETGDVAVRADIAKSFILKQAPASLLANWIEILSPPATVNAVFGRVGMVAAQAGDYNSTQVTNASQVAGANVSAALDALDGAVAAEVSARGLADTALNVSLSSEISNRMVADTNIVNALNTEITNRTDADDALNGAIAAETLSRQNADLALHDEVVDEASARDLADVAIRATATSNYDLLHQVDVGLDSALTLEIGNRSAADGALGTRIDDEIVARDDADVALGVSISNETAARIAGDNAAVKLAGSTMTGALYLSEAPGHPMQAVNKSYVDGIAAGLNDFKDSVDVATTGNVTLSGLQTIDGVSVVEGTRVLVKDQPGANENGIWVAHAGAWTRATDFDGSPSNEITPGAFMFVEQGVLNAKTSWVLRYAGYDEWVSGLPLFFSKFGQAGQIIDGNGLYFSGSTLHVGASDGSISSDVDGVAVKLQGNTLSKDVDGLYITPGQFAANTHMHPTSQVSGLDTALAGKAATAHTHVTADVANLDTALSGKSDFGHTHVTGEITGLLTALSDKASATHTHTPAVPISMFYGGKPQTNDIVGIYVNSLGSGSGFTVAGTIYAVALAPSASATVTFSVVHRTTGGSDTTLATLSFAAGASSWSGAISPVTMTLGSSLRVVCTSNTDTTFGNVSFTLPAMLPAS
jgi:hypothetical protein